MKTEHTLIPNGTKVIANIGRGDEILYIIGSTYEEDEDMETLNYYVAYVENPYDHPSHYPNGWYDGMVGWSSVSDIVLHIDDLCKYEEYKQALTTIGLDLENNGELFGSDTKRLEFINQFNQEL